jgi:diacylglycerol kinase family enzyme
MSLRERWHASRRLRTGAHVPHPRIASRRSRQETFTFDRPMALWLDGVSRGTVRSLSVSVVPDATEIYLGETE